MSGHELAIDAGPVQVWRGDCIEVLRTLPDASVDAVVTDPPYGISFMGKQWDQPGQFGSKRKSGGLNHRRGDKDDALEAGKYDLSPHAMRNFQRWCEAWAAECLRILKPGGHLLAFGGSRTWHRLAAGIEDAGFEIRDSIAWLYGSGFPKSLDVAKAITATQRGFGGSSGAQRKAAMGENYVPSGRLGNRDGAGRLDTGLTAHTLDLTPDAQSWEGWGTALKPSFEPIVVGRKPLAGTVAENVLAHGTGGLNIASVRVPISEADAVAARVPMRAASPAKAGTSAGRSESRFEPSPGGRWPTNVLLDQEAAAELDAQSGHLKSGPVRAGTERQPRAGGVIFGDDQRSFVPADTYGDEGGASRFFPTFRYEAKAPSSERPEVGGVQHPTVKPLALMRWLVRLVTPPGGTVLEPFAGSGTTLEASLAEGFSVIGIEREADYLPLIEARLSKPIQQGLFEGGVMDA